MIGKVNSENIQIKLPKSVNSDSLETTFRASSLNTRLWGKTNPNPELVGNFEGTLVCQEKGSKVELIEGWPIDTPGLFLKLTSQ